jgi:hypothetical protein
MGRIHKSVYFDVCCYIWDKGTACPEPELALMLSDVDGWQNILDTLIAAGKLARTPDGIVNERAMDEATRALEVWRRKSSGGRRGAEKTNAAKTPDGTPDRTPDGTPDGIGAALPTQNQNQNQNQNQITTAPTGATRKRVNVNVETMLESLPGLSESVASDYLAYRKTKKAPLTKTAWDRIAGSIRGSPHPPDECLAVAMMRGWQGFEASWMENQRETRQRDQARISPAERTRLAIEDRRRRESFG